MMMGGVAGTLIGGAMYKHNIKNYSFEFYPNHENIEISNMLKEYFDSFNPNIFLSASALSQLVYMGKVYKKSLDSKFTREYVIMEDGGQTSLDFNSKNDKNNKKIVMIIHGLTGGSNTAYIQHMVKSCEDRNFNSVVMHSRGINKTRLLNPKLPHPSN